MLKTKLLIKWPERIHKSNSWLGSKPPWKKKKRILFYRNFSVLLSFVSVANMACELLVLSSQEIYSYSFPFHEKNCEQKRLFKLLG